jgi:glycosyltransferase involved in cell wall biosynthesis
MAFPPSIGGSQTYSQGLARALARLGHEIHVVVADINDAEAFFELGHRQTGLRHEVDAGVAIHRIPLLPRHRQPPRSSASNARRLLRNRKRFRRSLRRTLDELAPDVVITLPHIVPSVQEVIRLAGESQWKLVYAPHLHEEDPWWRADEVAAAVGRSDGLIALTGHERDRLVAAYGARADQIAVIPPGVETAAAAPEGEREPIVLFLGRRSASKRIDTLVAAMQIVWASVPTARLVVAGPISDGFEDPTGPLAGDERVTVLDTVVADERSALLAVARVVATASVIEAFGITTLEAWSHRTPVVVADTEVARCIVRHGVDGLIGQRSPEGLATQLVRILEEPDLARRMGEAGRLRTEREFTWERAGRELDGLITGL